MQSAAVNEKVLIAICAHNNEETIERSIGSVFNQTFTNWKLLIIVSKSSDRTLVKCRSYSDSRIQVIEKLEQQSWAKSSIEAIDKAETEFFMWLDADDFLEREWLDRTINILTTKNCQGAIGQIKLSNDGGKTLISNISNYRKYSFAKSDYSFVRVSSYLLLPESYGAVNMLYSVWRTEFLRQTITWEESDKSMDFDTKFMLNALSRSSICTVTDTFLVRENRGSNNHVVLSFESSILNQSFFSRAAQLIWQLCVTKPRGSIYLKWALNNPKFLFLVMPIVAIRQILSVISPILISVHLRMRR